MMGAISPFALASIALTAASTVGSMQSGSASPREGEREAELARRQAAADRNFATADQARRDRLQRALAARRAGLAAGGISSDGSGAALLANLLDDSEAERAELAADHQDRLQDFAAAGRVNLLRARRQGAGGMGGMGGLARGIFALLPRGGGSEF